MATPNIIPRANNEGRLGKSGTQWLEVHAQSILQNGASVASLASPVFTGSPEAPTPATSDNNTNIATTAWVRNVFAAEGIVALGGSFSDGDIPEFDTASSSFVTSGLSAAQLASRSNHTGTQAQSTVTDLVSDLATINANIATNTSSIGSHASNHTDGTDDIQDATASQKGLMTAAFATKLDGIETGADVTDATNVQAAGALMDSEVLSLSGIKTLTIPDSTTITAFATSLLNDLSAAAMRTTLELSSADTPEFTSVTASDPSNGFKYSGTASAKITLQDVASATNFRLPSGGSGVENLVDGDGRGVTDSDAFRTAIDVGATGTLLMDAASASAARSTLGSTTVGDSVFIAASEAAARTAIGSTATGDSLLTAASAAAARTAIGSTTVGDAVFIAASESAARSAIGAETAADIGFGFLSVASSALTTINTQGTFEVAAATTFQAEDATNFSVPSATSCSTRYNGTATKKFKVSIKTSVTMPANNKIAVLAVGKNGSAISETEQKHHYDKTGTDEVGMAAEGIIELATNDTIEVMVANDTDTTDITLDKCTVIITPI